MRDFDADRRLPPFVFTPIHQSHDPQHGFPIKAHLNHFLDRSIVFDIGFQDRIQYRIRRQTVFVFLIGPQFSRRRPIQNRVWG